MTRKRFGCARSRRHHQQSGIGATMSRSHLLTIGAYDCLDHSAISMQTRTTIFVHSILPEKFGLRPIDSQCPFLTKASNRNGKRFCKVSPNYCMKLRTTSLRQRFRRCSAKQASDTLCWVLQMYIVRKERCAPYFSRNRKIANGRSECGNHSAPEPARLNNFFTPFEGTFPALATLPLAETHAALHATRTPISRFTLGRSPRTAMNDTPPTPAHPASLVSDE